MSPARTVSVPLGAHLELRQVLHPLVHTVVWCWSLCLAGPDELGDRALAVVDAISAGSELGGGGVISP